MTVVGQAGNVADGVSVYDLRPDVVVTDLQLPDGTASTSCGPSAQTATPSGSSC